MTDRRTRGAAGTGVRSYRRTITEDLALLTVMRAELRVYLRHHRVPDTVVSETVLCVHEAAMNGIRCGGGRVDVSVWVRGGRIGAAIRDGGPGFRVGPSVLDLTATGGRGLYLMRFLMDHVQIDCSHGTVVRMERRLPDVAGTSAAAIAATAS